MKPEKIKIEIAKRGYTLSMVAETIGRSPSLVSKIVAGKARSFDAANAVAKAIEKPLGEVFPGRNQTARQRDYKQGEEYRSKLTGLRS